MATEKPFDLQLTVREEDVTISYVFDLDRISNNHIFKSLATGGTYESEVSNFLVRVLKEGDTFVDIGAHIGYFSLLATKFVGRKGRVLAVEPDDDNLAQLTKHKELNDAANLEIFPYVLGEREEEKTFYVNSDNDGGHSLWDVSNHAFNKKSAVDRITRKVQTKTLDTLTEEAMPDAIKLLKIDTEGAEPLIMQGARKTFETTPIQFIVSEINEFGLAQLGSSQMEYRAQMKELGYDTFFLDEKYGFPTLLPETVAVVSGKSMVFNVLFSTMEALTPYWGVHLIR